MNLVVYTANFGLRDDELRPPPNLPGVRFVAFTDQEAPGWEVLPPYMTADTDRRTARLHKCLAHRLFPEADATLWMDASFEPIVPLDKYVADVTENLKYDFCTFKHANRVCLYQEIRACAAMGKDDAEVLFAQGRRYSEAGYPYYNGLCETGIIVRANTTKAAGIGEQWWREIEKSSCRDQISLPFVLWQYNHKYKQLPGRAMYCPHGFRFHSHCFRFR